MGQGIGIACSGIVGGIITAFALTRRIAAMLFRVDASDPSTFVLAGLFLALVALIATWLPAWRATRIDPVTALSGEERRVLGSPSGRDFR